MKNKKNGWMSLIIIILIIAFAVYVKTRPSEGVSDDFAKCVGEKGILYVQIGCHYCTIQEEMFGGNSEYLDIFVCNSDNWHTCQELDIMGTPTWIIEGVQYRGVQTIEELKNITGC